MSDQFNRSEDERKAVKPQVELTGLLKQEFLALEQKTSIPRTELLRQGLVRLINEWKATGELTIKSLSPPGAQQG